MTWLILQMLLCLALAFGLGLVLGWWMRGLGIDDARRRDGDEWEKRLADYKRRLEACREECQSLADRLAACEARSEELARRLAEAMAEREAGDGAAPAREAAPEQAQPESPERWVVTGDETPDAEES